jgi:hypothetical protein
MGRGTKYQGRGVKIPWVGGQYNMGRGSQYHGDGCKNTIGKWDQNTMGGWVKIPSVSGSLYHG